MPTRFSLAEVAGAAIGGQKSRSRRIFDSIESRRLENLQKSQQRIAQARRTTERAEDAEEREAERTQRSLQFASQLFSRIAENKGRREATLQEQEALQQRQLAVQQSKQLFQREEMFFEAEQELRKTGLETGRTFTPEYEADLEKSQKDIDKLKRRGPELESLSDAEWQQALESKYQERRGILSRPSFKKQETTPAERAQANTYIDPTTQFLMGVDQHGAPKLLSDRGLAEASKRFTVPGTEEQVGVGQPFVLTTSDGKQREYFFNKDGEPELLDVDGGKAKEPDIGKAISDARDRNQLDPENKTGRLLTDEEVVEQAVKDLQLQEKVRKAIEGTGSADDESRNKIEELRVLREALETLDAQANDELLQRSVEENLPTGSNLRTGF